MIMIPFSVVMLTIFWFLIMTNVAASVDCWVGWSVVLCLYQEYFVGFENFSIVVFTIEYLLHVLERRWCRPAHTTWRQRWNWFKSPTALIDLVAIVPAFLNSLCKHWFALFADFTPVTSLSWLAILLLCVFYWWLSVKKRLCFKRLFYLNYYDCDGINGIYLVENHASAWGVWVTPSHVVGGGDADDGGLWRCDTDYDRG